MRVPPSPPPKKRPRPRGKEALSVDACAQLISMGFGLVGMTRPEPLRNCWIVQKSEAAPAAEPLAATLNTLLPEHLLASALSIINPLAAATAIYALYAICKAREEETIAYYRGFQNSRPASNGAGSAGAGGTPGAAAPSAGPAAGDSQADWVKPVDINYE